MTKVIIFDFWGTLIENGIRPSPSKQIRYFLRVNMPFSEFITPFEEAFMTRKFDSLQEGFVAVAKHFDKHIPDFVYDKMVGMWNKFSILSRPFVDTIEALEDLKKDYKLVLLANTDNFSLRQVMDKYNLEQYFDKIYLSCETGLLKGNVESYNAILKDFDCSSDEAVMIGDSMQSDIESSSAAGVPAILVDRREWSDFSPKVDSLLDIRKALETLHED